jgi:hypothetical protein
VARYSDDKNEKTAPVKVYTKDGEITETFVVIPLPQDQIPATV